MQRSDSCSCTAASTLKKSARSRSSMFTKTTRDSPSSSARFQTRAVFTSTPITPERTTRAPSTTRSDATVSAWKPESPGVSIRLILRPCQSRLQSAAERDIWRRCSSSSQSATVLPASIAPSRFVFPAWKSRASTSEVLPVPRWPTTATLRIFPASMGIESSCGGGGRSGWNESYCGTKARARTATAAETATPPTAAGAACFENRPSRPRPTDATAAPDEREEPRIRPIGAGKQPVRRRGDPDAERRVMRAPPEVMRDLLAERVRHPHRCHQLGGDDPEADRERPIAVGERHQLLPERDRDDAVEQQRERMDADEDRRDDRQEAVHVLDCEPRPAEGRSRRHREAEHDRGREKQVGDDPRGAGQIPDGRAHRAGLTLRRERSGNRASCRCRSRRRSWRRTGPRARVHRATRARLAA